MSRPAGQAGQLLMRSLPWASDRSTLVSGPSNCNPLSPAAWETGLPAIGAESTKGCVVE